MCRARLDDRRLRRSLLLRVRHTGRADRAQAMPAVSNDRFTTAPSAVHTHRARAQSHLAFCQQRSLLRLRRVRMSRQSHQVLPPLIATILSFAHSFPLPIASITNIAVPFHGFIFDPPSRGYLCKFEKNYDCSQFKAADHISHQYNRTYPDPQTLEYPWTRIDLSDYLHFHNRTHARLSLHWHNSPDLPRINEYILLESTDHLHVELLHVIRASQSTTMASTIGSARHYVAYRDLRKYGALVAVWFTADTSILQIIDYYYEHGRSNSSDMQMRHMPQFYCRTIFDRAQCAQKSWTIAACNALYFYKCDRYGTPTTLAKCSPYFRNDITQENECSTVDIHLRSHT